MKTVWDWYSKDSVQKALIEVGRNREVISVFKDGSFGKRPDVIQYPSDIVQAVSSGTVAFHGSVERWSQPMKLDVGMAKNDLDNLRDGWDIIIDPDVKDFEIAKIVTKKAMEALKDHGVRSYSVKFTGGKGFHIGIGFESLPKKVNFEPVNILYPSLLQKVTEFVKSYMEPQLKEELLRLDSPENLAGRVGKPIETIMHKDEIDPYKIISMDIFSSRHLFRLPYSLHETTMLVSLPIKAENLDRFERQMASPEKANVEEKFLIPKAENDAELLIVEALDWAAKYKEEIKGELPRLRQPKQIKFIPEVYFPPCIRRMLEGMADGKKRGLFVLINFLRNMGWDSEKIEQRITEWNGKNMPSLTANYVRSQLRWHFRQGDRNLAPPNCENENFYKSMGLHDLCRDLHAQGIKNPVSYPIRRMSRIETVTKRKSTTSKPARRQIKRN